MWTVARRKTGIKNPTERELADYLNSNHAGVPEREGGDIRSIWTRTRKATTELRKHSNVCWHWNDTRKEMEIIIPSHGQPDVARIHPVARSHLVGHLRRSVRNVYLKKLIDKPDQGKVFEASARWSVSNHFIRSGQFTRFCDWRFIHRARVDCLPLNGTRRFDTEGDKRCRRCGYATETLPHVINHCRHQLVNMTGRHDAILDRIVKAVPASLGTASINRKVADSSSALRPDLVVTDMANRKVVIVDVTVPFENRYEALEAARLAKMDKYEPLVKELTEKGFEVEMDALVVGSLGAWDPANERTLRILKIGRRYSRMMRKLISSEAIQWSRDIYIQHITGHPQRQSRPTRPDPQPTPDNNDTNDADNTTPAPTFPNIPTNMQHEGNTQPPKIPPPS